MPPKKLPLSKLKKSARYYRTGSSIKGKSNSAKAKLAVQKKDAKSKEINSLRSQRKKRAELVKERRKRGIYGKGGKDVSHTKNGFVLKDPSLNRGDNNDTKGDSRSRGVKSKRKKS